MIDEVDFGTMDTVHRLIYECAGSATAGSMLDICNALYEQRRPLFMSPRGSVAQSPRGSDNEIIAVVSDDESLPESLPDLY